MFLPRTLSASLAKYGKKFPVILVSGARQVGKSTLLRTMHPEMTYVSLDDPAIRLLAQEEPKLFLNRYPAPLIIDEVQYAPELFSLIKLQVDNIRTPGQYWLSGSQQFHLMKNVSETLAGRIGILQLAGLSTRELLNVSQAKPVVDRLNDADAPALPAGETFKRIWRGSYPALHTPNPLEPEEFFPSYVQTYIERDVRDLSRVGDERAFLIFMRLLAGRTGQLLNIQELANATGVSVTAIRSWLSILQTSGVITLLEPYHANALKRLVKTPKLYFMDTGLAAWLAGWTSPDTLARGAAVGAFFETYVISEIIKSYWHSGQRTQLSFYRDHDGREVDLLVVRDNQVTALEIKTTSRPDRRLAKTIQIGDKLGMEQQGAAIICQADTLLPLTSDTVSYPVGMI